MRRFRLLATSTIPLLAWSIVQACGGEVATIDGGADVTAANDAGTGNDASTGNDAGAGNDGTTGLTYRCGFDVEAGTVTDCSQCTGMTMPCVYCDQNDVSVLAGFCVTFGDECPFTAPNGFLPCSCGDYGYGDAGACPESYQVCMLEWKTNYCYTCGASAFIGGHACKGGGTCNADDGGCK